MEKENLSFFDAVRVALGKKPKIRRRLAHVQEEMKCQRIRANASRWKTGRVYPESVEIDSTKEGYGEKDTFSGDFTYLRVSAQERQILGEVNNDRVSYHIIYLLHLAQRSRL